MNKRFFVATLSMIMAMFYLSFDTVNAAPRTGARGTPVSAGARKSVTTAKAEVAVVVETEEVEEEPEEEPEVIIENKSSSFETTLSSVIESSSADNSFAEQIRKQRAALAASESASMASSSMKKAMASNSNTCDRDLRKCMTEKCGKDFTKCATDGDTILGDKLNACKTKTKCSAEEFAAFVPEIKADMEMNIRMGSFDNVINCGNEYNACIINECGDTYSKCLGKKYSDAAVQKCAMVAKECTEADSGLANRFGTAIGKLRENAEIEVKRDEERLYALRDLMSGACKKLGAMFDERSFDCVYTVNFFVGEKQDFPSASRKRYAGDSFVCMQEWFGANVTTALENAARETKAQTAASSAMLGSGVGTAAGIISSGAMDRAIDTQKAKKELKTAQNAEKKAQKKEDRKERKDQRKAKTAENSAIAHKGIEAATDAITGKGQTIGAADGATLGQDLANKKANASLSASFQNDLRAQAERESEKLQAEPDEEFLIRGRPEDIPEEEEEEDLSNITSATTRFNAQRAAQSVAGIDLGALQASLAPGGGQ